MIPVKVAYYVSGHGFGHATRAIPIIQNIVSSIPVIIYLCTPHPEYLFPSNFFGSHSLGTVLLRIVESSYDGVVQDNAITVNKEKTAARLEEIKERSEDIILSEARWLKQEHIVLVLSDAPFLVVESCKRIKIKCFSISNFLWDSIYESFLGESATAIIKWISSIYQNSYWLRMPGYISSPAFANDDNRIIDIPSALRKPSGKSRTEILSNLFKFHEWKNISLDTLLSSKILLVAFGGHYLSLKNFDNLVPSDGKWIILTAGITLPNHIRTDIIFPLNSTNQDLHFPDIVKSCTVVLGKLGYGTCGDVIAACKPMVYVSRAGFVEEAGLVRWMNGEQFRGQEMPINDFLDGNWSQYIHRASEIVIKEDFEFEDPSLKIIDLIKQHSFDTLN